MILLRRGGHPADEQLMQVQRLHRRPSVLAKRRLDLVQRQYKRCAIFVCVGEASFSSVAVKAMCRTVVGARRPEDDRHTLASSPWHQCNPLCAGTRSCWDPGTSCRFQRPTVLAFCSRMRRCRRRCTQHARTNERHVMD